MAKHIVEYFPDHSLYLEPFGGGASLLFRKQPCAIEVYNDLEKNVYSLMKVLWDKSLFKEFKEKSELALYSRLIREEFKEDLKLDSLSLVDRAFKYWYVNRTSFDGSGGFSVITTYVRRNTSKSISDFVSSIDGLQAIHERLQNVIVENKNASDLIPQYDREGVLMYCDPPYHHDTRTNARYVVDMDNEQQKQFINMMLANKNAKIIISGYNCTEYDRLCQAGWNRVDLSVKQRKGDNTKKDVLESLWMNYEL